MTVFSPAKGAEVDRHPKLHQDEEPDGKEGGHEDKPSNYLIKFLSEN